jgi:hypothetical protein
MCMVKENGGSCSQESVFGWQRFATAEEIQAYIASGDLSSGTTEATVPQYSCDEHKLTSELMSKTHPSSCVWESTGQCECDPEDLTSEGIPYEG